MTVTVLYFAGLSESLGTAGETIAVPAGATTAGDLRDYIAGRGEPWAQLARVKNLRCAVNQALVDFDAVVKEGDEVAFFPPVTGG